MNNQFRKLFAPVLLLFTAWVVLAMKAMSQTYTGWSILILAIVMLLMVVFWIRQKVVAEKKTLQTFRTVEMNIASFLFNNGKQQTTHALTNLEAELKNATTFIKDIGDGKFDTDYTGMTPELKALNESTLAGELMDMKRKMQQVAEEERQRAWIATGLAHFSEIVRQQHVAVDDMLNQFISELVKYTHANQGGIFVANTDDADYTVLELKGCYAYSRRKFMARTIAPGQGLVGQAYLEGEVVCLTDIPANYLTITSGLGEATPRYVILVPLRNHDTIEGIIEIASFEVLKNYEVDFLVQVGAILGSAISAIKINEVTKKLLADSQLQAEQLRAQEEELRQNLEELNATQEAVERKSREAQEQNSKLNAILDSAADTIITINEKGDLESINMAGATLLGYSETEIVGKPIEAILPHTDHPEDDQFLKHYLETGKTQTVVVRALQALHKRGNRIPIELTINMVRVGNKKIFTGILRDITERIKTENDQLQYIEELQAQEEELKQNMEELHATQEEIQRRMQETNKLNHELDARVAALNTSTIMSESDLYGGITYVNDKFCEVSHYSREELIGQPHKIVRHADMPKEVFKLMWSTIKAGKVFRGIVKNRKKDGSHYWVDAVISPVLDDERRPLKYIGVRYVIEDDVLGEKLFHRQFVALGLLKEELGRQHWENA